MLEGGLIFDLSVLTEREVTGHIIGSESHIDIAIVRLIHTGLFALIGLAGFISCLVMRKNLKTTFSLLAITLTTLPLVVLSGFYAMEILTRVYTFALPGLAFFGASLLDIKRKMVAFILSFIFIVSIPLYLIASYGNQEFDYFSPGQQAGLFFFHDMTRQGLVFGAFPIGTFANIEEYHNIGLERLEWKDDRLVVAPRFTKIYSAYYIGINRQNRVHYEWLLGNPDFIRETEQQLQGATNCNFIYYSPDLSLYISEKQ